MQKVRSSSIVTWWTKDADVPILTWAPCELSFAHRHSEPTCLQKVEQSLDQEDDRNSAKQQVWPLQANRTFGSVSLLMDVKPRILSLLSDWSVVDGFLFSFTKLRKERQNWMNGLGGFNGHKVIKIFSSCCFVGLEKGLEFWHFVPQRRSVWIRRWLKPSNCVHTRTLLSTLLILRYVFSGRHSYTPVGFPECGIFFVFFLQRMWRWIWWSWRLRTSTLAEATCGDWRKAWWFTLPFISTCFFQHGLVLICFFEFQVSTCAYVTQKVEFAGIR